MEAVCGPNADDKYCANFWHMYSRLRQISELGIEVNKCLQADPNEAAMRSMLEHVASSLPTPEVIQL